MLEIITGDKVLKTEDCVNVFNRVEMIKRNDALARRSSADPQPLRRKGDLQAQEEPGDRRRSHAVRHRLTGGGRRNRR